MLEQLIIKNGFRHPHSVFNFQAGQTAITGENESGKSVTLEMILFALWGSVALRGVADDYKKLDVTLTFVVKDQRYRVNRTIKNAKLIRAPLNDNAEHDVAVGTKPVNLKMKEIFGYDYSVFTMANAVMQGAVEALSDAKPGERKKIVDQTVGLAVLDDLIKEAGEQALKFARQAEGIAGVLREPVQPEVPENYESSSTLALKRQEAVLIATELNQLRGMVANKPAEPVAPVCEVNETVATLQSLQDIRGQLLDARKLADSNASQIMREKTTVEGELLKLAAQLDGESYSAKQLAQVRAKLAELKLPEMTTAAIDEQFSRNEKHARWAAKQKLLAQGHHSCPKCSHTWPVASEELDAYADAIEIQPSQYSAGYLNAQRALQFNVDLKKQLEDSIPQLERDVAAEKEQIAAKMDEKVKQIAEKVEAFEANAKNIVQLDDLLKANPDQSGRIAERQKFDGALLAHGAQVAAYEQFFAQLKEREARIRELEPVEGRLVALEERLVASRAYEQAQGAYEASVRSYVEDKLKMDGLLEQSTDWTNAKAAIAEAKVVIKSYLVPSLNKVASMLINQMTGGARSSIVVDDEFNITVDGQQVQTLSGSGKAVANLALRIGLGQVLTNGVFSVFMADEFDESMDEKRARYTAECLQRLKETIKQVIVVTHKRPIADHVFTLPLKEAA
jgi:DNA repair exonuclease SbcCD ATPase subunit